MRTERQTCGTRVIWGICGVPLSLFATLGCEAQAGEGYTGEPLFSLRGQVLVSEPGAGDLVPALVFEGEERTIIDGEVRGEFPANFRFDVMQPPPSTAFPAWDFSTTAPALRGKIAPAYITVVPREHPRAMPKLFSNVSRSCNDDETRCTLSEETCTADERCRYRTFDCIEEYCPVVSSQGAALGESAFWRKSSLECLQDVCMSASDFCSAEAGCSREIRKCDMLRTGPGTRISTGGAYETCTLAAESGDTALSEFEHLDRSARGLAVFYATEANDIPGFGRLEPGYSLVEAVPPPEQEWISALHCKHDAEFVALDAYNQRHGTSHTVAEGYDEEVRIALEPEIESIQARCPRSIMARLVREPLEHELILRIADRMPGNPF